MRVGRSRRLLTVFRFEIGPKFEWHQVKDQFDEIRYKITFY